MMGELLYGVYLSKAKEQGLSYTEWQALDPRQQTAWNNLAFEIEFEPNERWVGRRDELRARDATFQRGEEEPT